MLNKKLKSALLIYRQRAVLLPLQVRWRRCWRRCRNDAGADEDALPDAAKEPRLRATLKASATSAATSVAGAAAGDGDAVAIEDSSRSMSRCSLSSRLFLRRALGRSSPGYSSSLLKELVLGLHLAEASRGLLLRRYLYLCRLAVFTKLGRTCRCKRLALTRPLRLCQPEMKLPMPELHMMEKCPAQKIGHHVGLDVNQISRLATANQATQATQANRMNQGNQLGVPQSC